MFLLVDFALALLLLAVATLIFSIGLKLLKGDKKDDKPGQ